MRGVTLCEKSIIERSRDSCPLDTEREECIERSRLSQIEMNDGKNVHVDLGTRRGREKNVPDKSEWFCTGL